MSDFSRPVAAILIGKPDGEEVWGLVKVIAMMKRKSGITPDEFARYWYEEHAPLGLTLLPEEIDIRGYVQNYAVPSEGDQEPEFDGVVELCLDDMKAFHGWLSWFMREDAKPMRDDEQNFMDSSSVKLVVVEERVVVPRNESAVVGA
jgi:uncharacterized protein (TIGR02118 family)